MEPQPKVGGDAADYALVAAGPKKKRLVLIEVKSPSEALAKGEDQLGKYIGRDEAGLAVLTNGRNWWLYLVRAAGKFPERRFAELDLVEDVARFVEVSLDVLAKPALSDKAQSGLLRAAGLLKERRDEEYWQEELPTVWSQLISEPDDDLARLVQGKAATGGASPSVDAVRAFLRSTAAPAKAVQRLQPSAGRIDLPRKIGKGAPGGLPPPHARPKAADLGGLALHVRKWKDVLVESAKYASDHGALPVPYLRGKRVIVSTALDDFKLDTYRRGAARLPNGAFLDTWWSGRDCVRVARELLDAAGLDGRELHVTWEEKEQHRG